MDAKTATQLRSRLAQAAQNASPTGNRTAYPPPQLQAFVDQLRDKNAAERRPGLRPAQLISEAQRLLAA